jgi:hypothetical protein
LIWIWLSIGEFRVLKTKTLRDRSINSFSWKKKKRERARERVVRESRSVIFCTCGEHVWDLKDQTDPGLTRPKKSGSELHEYKNIHYKLLIFVARIPFF